jgi:hypothetical protein
MIEHLRISRAERLSVPVVVVLDAGTDVNAWFQPGPNDFVGLAVDSNEESLGPVKALDLARRNFQSGALKALDDQILVLREQQDYVVEIQAWGKELKVHLIPEIWRMSWKLSSIFTYGSPDQISATKLDLHISSSYLYDGLGTLHTPSSREPKSTFRRGPMPIFPREPMSMLSSYRNWGGETDSCMTFQAASQPSIP